MGSYATSGKKEKVLSKSSSTSYDLYEYEYRRIPSVDEVNAAEEALNRIRKDIQDRRDAKAQEASVIQFPFGLSSKIIKAIFLQPSGTPSTWISRVTSTLSGNSGIYNQIINILTWSLSTKLGSAALRRELDGLIALEYQMDRNLEILREERTQANYNLTLKGQVFKWSGRSFALYCVFRTLSVHNNTLWLVWHASLMKLGHSLCSIFLCHYTLTRTLRVNK